MRLLGSKVTALERNDRLLHREIDDVREALADLFDEEGIDTLLRVRDKRVCGKPGEVVAVVAEQTKKTALMGTRLLIAAGRASNTENIELR